MGIGIPSFVKKGVETVKDAGSGAVNKAKDVGSGAVDRVKDVGGKVVDKAADVGETVGDKGKDVVQFSGEVLEEGGKATLGAASDFGSGVVEWGKSTVGTVAGIASHPVETAKAVGNLATNPIINPVAAPARFLIGAAQGKNPAEVYKEGADQLKGIGEGLASDWKKVYKEHGIAGVAGFAAPDVALAVLTGGGSAGAKAGGTAAAKGVAREVAESGAREVVEDAATTSVARGTAKQIGKEVAPGPEDVTDNARKERQNLNPDQNWFEALVSNFQF